MSARTANEGDVKLLEHAYVTRVYKAKVGEGETLDMVRDPGFWANIARKVRVGDKFEIIADDGTWEWHGRAVATNPVEVYTRELFFWEGEPVAPIASKAVYRVNWAGPTHKHRVERIADPDKPDAIEIVKHGFDDRGSAESWLASNVPGFRLAA